MRSITRSFALALSLVILSSSLPVFAAEPRVKDRSGEHPSIVVVVKRLVKRLFGITTNDDMTVPKP
ncbi:MAG TPA: hypothetical protein VJZ00_23815 [Thermoanaerobaculia bacterium]|nr:hypothetical protein [Thermoanaerobaculia bacterium]